MQLAASARVPVILDAGGAERPLAHDLLTNVSILSPNETELERLTGMPTKSEKEIIEAAESLVHQGVDKVLVKLGAKGSLMVGTHFWLIYPCSVLPAAFEPFEYYTMTTHHTFMQIFMEIVSSRRQKKSCTLWTPRGQVTASPQHLPWPCWKEKTIAMR